MKPAAPPCGQVGEPGQSPRTVEQTGPGS